HLFLSVLFPRPRSLSSLPSFPTRRSSDLAPDRVRVADSRGDGEPPDGGVPTTRGPARLGDPRGPGPAKRDDRAPARRAAGRHPPDRKSTRLNSSHQIISYAVFCLKKKTNH